LGLQNDEQLGAYIDNAQKQLDSNKENTLIIADLLKQILVQLGGTPRDDGGHSEHGQPGSGVDNTGTHSGRGLPGASSDRPVGPSRNITDEDAEAIGDAVGRRIERYGSDARR
jgi:hypothetical protein